MAAKKKNVIQKTFTVPQLAVETRRLARVIQMDSLGRYVSNGPASLNTKTKKGFEVKYSFTGGTLSQGVAKPGAQPGQTKPVASSSGTSLSGVTIEIAQDLTKMQVDTNVDESDVGNIAVGQKAVFTVDSYPDATFHGVVADVRKAPIIT